MNQTISKQLVEATGRQFLAAAGFDALGSWHAADMLAVAISDTSGTLSFDVLGLATQDSKDKKGNTYDAGIRVKCSYRLTLDDALRLVEVALPALQQAIATQADRDKVTTATSPRADVVSVPQSQLAYGDRLTALEGAVNRLLIALGEVPAATAAVSPAPAAPTPARRGQYPTPCGARVYKNKGSYERHVANCVACQTALNK